jgi:hypothetical protein
MRSFLNRTSLLLLLLLLAGCGATAPAKKSAPVEPAPKGGYDFRKEGKIPQSSSTRPETDVEEIAVADTSLEVTDADAPPVVTTPPAAATTDSTVDGFRIQLFASSDRDVAQNARDVAVTRLGIPVYLDLEGGVYKVRAGDFPTREDAAATLPAVRSPYYPDAWIVAARIKAARQ